MPNPNLINEDQIPSNWAPVQTAATVPGRAPLGAPAPPVPHDMPQFFSGSMPPALQHDTSFVGTEVGSPRIPKYSLMPLGNQGSPFTNAAASSTTVKIIQSTPSTGGGLTSVGLSMPPQFAVGNSPLVANGVLGVTWNTEPPNFFLGGSLNAVGDVIDVALGADNSSGAATSLTFARAFPNNATQFAFMKSTVVPTGGAAGVTPTGWVVVPGDTTAYTLFPAPQPLQTSPSLGVNLIVTPTATIDGILLTFNTNGSTPTIAHNASYALNTASNPSTGGPFTLPAGQTFLVVITSLTSTRTEYSITDNFNNKYVSTVFTTDAGRAMQGFIVQSPLGGTCQLTIAWSSSNPPNSASIDGYSITNTTTSSVPKFRQIQQSDLPPLDLSQAIGTVPVANGGTGANLSATGGANFVVQQGGSGNKFTVAQLANKQLLNWSAADGINQANNTAPTGMFFVNAGQNGLYRVTAYAIVTTVAGTSSTLPDTEIIYTDADNSQVFTVPLTTGSTGNLLTTVQTATAVMNVKASTTISFGVGQVTPYASNPATAMRFAFHIRVEYIG